MTTKTEAASRVRTVLEAVKNQIAKPGGLKLNEATTRAHFLNPLLNALGYARMDELEFEHFLPDGKTFLDYRLHVDGKPRVAVEAKALDVALTDKEAAQAVGYAAILGDEWTVLSNARQWRLYHTFAQTPLAGKLVLSLDLVSWDTDAEFDRIFDQLWLVSRESFQAGDGPSSWVTSQKLDHELRHSLVDEASAEVRYIRKQLESRGVSVGAGDVAAWFRHHLTEPRATSKAALYPLAGASPSPMKASSPLGSMGASATAVKSIISSSGGSHWIIPAGADEGYSAADHMRIWLSKGFWGFGVSTPGRKGIKPGDWACFYAAGSHEVLATARISGDLDHEVGPADWPGPEAFHTGTYKVPVSELTWLEPAPVLDQALRMRLDAYKGKDPAAIWSWLVQTTHRISRDDYLRLTGQKTD